MTLFNLQINRSEQMPCYTSVSLLVFIAVLFKTILSFIR